MHAAVKKAREEIMERCRVNDGRSSWGPGSYWDQASDRAGRGEGWSRQSWGSHSYGKW